MNIYDTTPAVIFLSLHEVKRRTGYSNQLIYSKLADGVDDFPRPFCDRTGASIRLVWVEAELSAWQLRHAHKNRCLLGADATLQRFAREAIA